MESTKRRGRKRKPAAQPNRKQVSDAVEEFLKNGGKITKIETNWFTYYYKPYCSDQAIGMESLPMEFI